MAMTGYTRIYPEQIRAVSERFAEVGEDLAAAVSHTLTTLREAGAPWGADEEGEKFEARYVPAADTALAAMTRLAHQFSEIARALRATAARANSLDSALGDDLNRAHSGASVPEHSAGPDTDTDADAGAGGEESSGRGGWRGQAAPSAHGDEGSAQAQIGAGVFAPGRISAVLEQSPAGVRGHDGDGDR